MAEDVYKTWRNKIIEPKERVRMANSIFYWETLPAFVGMLAINGGQMWYDQDHDVSALEIWGVRILTLFISLYLLDRVNVQRQRINLIFEKDKPLKAANDNEMALRNQEAA